jgi:hypothetical protein
MNFLEILQICEEYQKLGCDVQASLDYIFDGDHNEPSKFELRHAYKFLRALQEFGITGVEQYLIAIKSILEV